MRRLTMLGGVVVVALMRCTSTYDIRLNGFNLDAGLNGFGCRDGNNRALINRVVDGGFMMVVDALDFGADQPPCVSVALDVYCNQKPGGCPVVARGCFPIKVAELGGNDAGLNAFQAGFAQLRTEDAGLFSVPEDRNIVLRITGVAADVCSSGATLAQEKNVLVGCSRSCPTQLTFSGTVDLYLDTPPGSTACEADVIDCAVLGLPPSAQP